MKKQIEYLGLWISEGVRTDPSKVEPMVTWPKPTNIKALRGFLGLSGFYCKVVKDYGKINRSLKELLKKNAFGWNDEVEAAFVKLKKAMTKISPNHLS